MPTQPVFNPAMSFRPIRSLPIVPLRPGAVRIAPNAITDAALKATVDTKLNAALKEEIKRMIGSGRPDVQSFIDQLSLDYHSVLGETIPSVIQKNVAPAMARVPALADFAKKLIEWKVAPGAPTVTRLLQPDVPLSAHPLFVDDVRRGKGVELLRISSLDIGLIEKLDAGRRPLEAWSDTNWNDAVKQKVLTQTQRDNLFFSTELSRLTGEQYPLVEALRGASINAIGDLIKWDSANWLAVVKQHPQSVPDGATRDGYAATLAKNVQQTYPSQYFAYHVVQAAVAQKLPLAPALGRFMQNNVAQDLHFMNLLDTSSDHGVDWSGISDADRVPLRKQLLGHQRVLHLTKDYDTAKALLNAGLDSSIAIADMGYKAFLEQTGLDDESGTPVYRAAMANASQIANSVQLFKDGMSSIDVGSYFQTVNPSFINDLARIEGYADLFGDTSYCDCEHCRSIFGPAAYFTDLMYFIEKNITNPAFKNRPKDPLRLDMRRPDLWHLKLTCENTDTLIPHLQLVLEILESYLQRTLSVTDVPKTLAADRSAIGLPFYLPLETVREYLKGLGTDLVSLYALLDAPDDAVLKETLRLSDAEWGAIGSTLTSDLEWIRFQTSDHSRMDVVDFLPFAGIDRDSLDALQATQSAGGFTIKRVKLPGGDIQSEKEVIEGLSDQLIDRIGRFLRLAKKGGYGITELDEILQTSRITDVARMRTASPFTANALSGLARFKRLAQKIGLSSEQLMGVLDHIPVRPMKAGDKSLADKTGLNALTFPLTFHHAHFNKSDPKDDKVDGALPALLTVVDVAEADLLGMFSQYPAAFAFDAKGNCQLTADNVALLYGHATLARAWHIAPGDLSIVVAKLLGFQGNDFRSLGWLEALEQTVTLVRSLPMGIADAVSLIDPATALLTIDQIVPIVVDMQQSGARLFGPDLLTSIKGVGAPDAAEILARLAKAGLISAQGDKYELTAAYTPATDLTAPLSAADPGHKDYSGHKDDIHAALMAFHFINLLPNALAATVGMSVDKAVAAFAFARPGWSDAAVLKALKTTIVDGAPSPDLQPLLTVACDLARLAQLFGRLGLQTADLWFIARYPAVLGIKDVRSLSVADLGAIRRYRQLLSGGTLTAGEAQNLLWQYHVRAHANTPLSPAGPFVGAIATAVPVFRGALNAPDLAAFQPAPAPQFSSENIVPSMLNGDEIALLAARNNLDATVLRSVFLSQVLPATALDALARALQLYSFCRTLGTQGATLSKLLPRDFAGLQGAADALLGLLQSRYGNPDDREKNLAPRTDALNMMRRDALCAYIISREKVLNFRTRDGLYAYFLIDVAMGGCFRTSRLVTAISSLQLYVYRCLVDLERSEKDQKFSVLEHIHADDISTEWEWRRNYRVWEANRKVFLYPENYIEPELLDIKTPLFDDLEGDVQQRRITLDAAEEAYHAYLVGFSALAQLQTVAACYDPGQDDPGQDDPGHNDRQDCYWFLARTHKDPFQYYMRCYHPATARWDAWEKVDLGISAPYVTPIFHLGRLYLFWVEITSIDKTEFVDGNSIFRGVQHHVMLHYSHRETNGKWASAQKQTLTDKLIDRVVVDTTPPVIKLFISDFRFFGIDKDQTETATEYYRGSKTYAKVSVQVSTSSDQTLMIDYFRRFARTEIEIKDNKPPSVDDSQYVLPYIETQGSEITWMKPNPVVTLEYWRFALDLISNELGLWDWLRFPYVSLSSDTLLNTNTRDTYSGGPDAIGYLTLPIPDPAGQPPPAAPESVTLQLGSFAPVQYPAATDDMLIFPYGSGVPVSDPLPTNTPYDALPINGRPEETILAYGKHQHWIRRAGYFTLRTGIRVNTTLDTYLAKVLYTKGIDKFLSLETQISIGEEASPFNLIAPVELWYENEVPNCLPFGGSFADYYQEMFFHIPFLIANQLNADGNYKDAKYWYEKIFNPTAPASKKDDNPKHRVWQYCEFRDLDIPKLKELLTDSKAIDRYQDDPFDPHAIARLRPGVYPKAIVMKYVGNLIDWGDSLFMQETRESLVEATMLYALAADILGPRPVSTGKCKTADENTLTYEVLGPAIRKGSEFLMYVENMYRLMSFEGEIRLTTPPANTNTPVNSSLLDTGLGNAQQYVRTRRLPRYAPPRPAEKPGVRIVGNGRPGRPVRPGRPDIVRQYLPAFCVPANEALLGLWDKIDDRLFKIRNCLDINGQPLKLALFQPPIDPMLLVRGKAAGLSVEDVLARQSEPLPAYRFTYMVEKARQFVGTVQSLGGALLSALEKKDAEQLSLLRSTHEQNVLKLQRSVKQSQIDEAQAQLSALMSQQQNVQNRIDYYNGLIQQNRIGWEQLEEASRHTAIGLHAAEAVTRLQGGILYLIPQLGSPFSLKYGGKELGDAASSVAQWYASMATIADAGAGAAGLEATFQRRMQEWQHQLTLATEELNQLTQQVLAAQIRAQIAQSDLDLHDTQIDQAQEAYDFLKNKFTSTGLYTFLSAQLMRLYRETYQMAAQMARRAERAYQFERFSDETFIQGDNWSSDWSGLMAGERLLVQIERMERAFVEANIREIEVSQSFALSQVDANALEKLQQTGKCSFTLDEIWFDLQYPGQYRRLIKSVRLTIPCVAGPYTNVGAMLRLESSQLRPAPDASAIVDVPPTMTRTIATSHAQNDAGVFELNFRDERYLPFEGAGAVNSTWTLELPSKIRMFDYNTLSDVIIHLSYTARHDAGFADKVQSNLVGTLQQHGLSRLVSLRHEFPNAFNRLLNPPAGQPQQATFALETRHFPLWLDGQMLQMSQVGVWPRAVKGQSINTAGLTLKVAGATVGSWQPDGAGSAQGTANVAGSPIRSWSIDAGAPGFDKATLDDLLLLIKYAVQ